MRYSNGQTMHDWQRKQIFGLRGKDKWPDAGFPERIHDHILYRVLPKQFGKHAKHRAQAQCPVCKQWKDAGHMGQHFSAHNARLLNDEKRKQQWEIDRKNIELYNDTFY